MQDGTHGRRTVLNKSQTQDSSASNNITASPIRHLSSFVPSRSHRRLPSPSSISSKTPLTPEESPPFNSTAKRRHASIVEDEDKEEEDIGSSPVHKSKESGDNSIHVCICQPAPKIPRPRNAFILYRQHHQASVVAQYPGLANPEISKIIGEQWQNQSAEIKNKWKALAEEEKIRHQQQYPAYRYQPKRGRRNSLSSEANREKPRCSKCGGRSILTPSTPYHILSSSLQSPISGPQTPGSALTPVSRTLPVLKELNIHSPSLHPMARLLPAGKMSPGLNIHTDDRDELGPLSPGSKRRRYMGDHQPTLTRVIGPRYAMVGPGTPYPFSQASPHPYPQGATTSRRESLPGLHGAISSSSTMGPPPRPGLGYQQHRMSQSHVGHDRSLTLAPLKTGGAGGVSGALASAASGKSLKDEIMSVDFRDKVRILRRVAPPAPVEKSAPRGPLVAIEGDRPDIVKEVASWLNKTLSKGDDLNVNLLEGPVLSAEGNKEELMAQFHRLAADWLIKSSQIRISLAISTTSPIDSLRTESTPTATPNSSVRLLDENYDDSDDDAVEPKGRAGKTKSSNRTKTDRSLSISERMDVDSPSKAYGSSSKPVTTSGKPVTIIPNYSLYTSNFFACQISLNADPYAPRDHWQWTATQWRGIIPPDLTIYVCDPVAGDMGKQSVEILEEGDLFVVKRSKIEGRDDLEIEPSTLRRLGFEASEWIRAFGPSAK